jgi:hypothetical protein
MQFTHTLRTSNGFIQLSDKLADDFVERVCRLLVNDRFPLILPPRRFSSKSLPTATSGSLSRRASGCHLMAVRQTAANGCTHRTGRSSPRQTRNPSWLALCHLAWPTRERHKTRKTLANETCTARAHIHTHTQARHYRIHRPVSYFQVTQ